MLNKLRMELRRLVLAVAIAHCTVTSRASSLCCRYKHFERLLNKNSSLPKQGDKVVGTVISLDQKNAYIDIGAKTAAVLPKEEMSIAKIDKVMPPSR